MKYCEQCGKTVETKIVSKEETYNVFGDQIKVNAQVLVCTECNEELFCEELDNATLINAYNEYRRRHKLLFPEEIRKIREQYGLSQRSFAKLLNWGDKTIHRYENGSIQDKAHNATLLFLREPGNMRMYLKNNEISLNKKQIDKILATVERLELGKNINTEHKILEMLFHEIPSEENGFKIFDYEKFCAMILFFANKRGRILKTKLMKLLNYSDMLFYKENSISISGAQYIHLPYGPVPNKFELLLEMMQIFDHIIHIEISNENGYECHHVIPDCDIPNEILSEKEINMLERIYDKFSDFGSVEISEYSHKEKGYISTEQGEVIPYTYAKDIQL